MIVRSEHFLRSYRKLAAEHRAKVDKALIRFGENPRHPSLHFELLVGTRFRSIRVTQACRIILTDGETKGDFVLVDVGSHDLQDRYGRRR